MHLGSVEINQEARICTRLSPGATLTLFLCSPNFPRASVIRYAHSKYEPIQYSYSSLRAGRFGGSSTCMIIVIIYCPN